MGKAIGIQVILLSIQGLLYLGVQKLEGPAHDVSCRLDEKIPFWTPGILIYVLWFPLIAIFPLTLFAVDQECYISYMMAIIVDIVLSCIVYLAYPSSFQRPVPPDSFTGKIVAILYHLDYTGKNCMPSMHCSMCFIIMYFALQVMGTATGLYVAFFILAVLIVISTVLTKQHVIIDVVTGFIAAVIAIGIALLVKGAIL